MPIPLAVLAGVALAGYALLKPHPTRANPFPDGNPPGPVPVPVPPPSVDPPAEMQVLDGVDLVADLSGAVPGQAGQSVPVTWMFTKGPESLVDTGGGTTLPLAWVAPDKSKAAVVWNVHPAYFLGDDTFRVGAIYAARPMVEHDRPVFTDAFSKEARQGGTTTSVGIT